MKTTRIVIAALLGLLALVATRTAHAADEQPNILFILTDNLGYGEVGVYGGGATRGAPTPHIDSLASQGLRLTNRRRHPRAIHGALGTMDPYVPPK